MIGKCEICGFSVPLHDTACLLCGVNGSTTSSPREKPMKQDATRKIAAQYLVGEATLEELDDATWDEITARKEAEIEKLRQDVRNLEREFLELKEQARRDRYDNDRDIEWLSRPLWKKLLGMK